MMVCRRADASTHTCAFRIGARFACVASAAAAVAEAWGRGWVAYLTLGAHLRKKATVNPGGLQAAQALSHGKRQHVPFLEYLVDLEDWTRAETT